LTRRRIIAMFSLVFSLLSVKIFEIFIIKFIKFLVNNF
jgi:hypothetical protein